MVFKEGAGWKCCFDPETGLYTAKIGGGVNQDLYEITKDIDDSCRSDMTHFNTENGAKTVGGAVVKCLCEILGIDEKELSAAKAEEAKIDADIMGV